MAVGGIGRSPYSAVHAKRLAFTQDGRRVNGGIRPRSGLFRPTPRSGEDVEIEGMERGLGGHVQQRNGVAAVVVNDDVTADYRRVGHHLMESAETGDRMKLDRVVG